MTMPTPEAFMTQPEPDEEEFETFLPALLTEWSEVPRQSGKNMEWVIESLQRIEGRLASTDHDEGLADSVRQELLDLEAKHAVLYALLEEIEAIIKPSVGKLAISVREAITRWRAPDTGPEGHEPWCDGAKGCGMSGCATERPDLGPPAPDAGIGIWRAYGVREGLPEDDVQTMNRSQIRTALGIEQPGAEA